MRATRQYSEVAAAVSDASQAEAELLPRAEYSSVASDDALRAEVEDPYDCHEEAAYSVLAS